ncbi:hypothetical protein [Yoonia vestfoldensis]|uniref:hypothetical protein n=1 Tax=Yoonia vestfoldensis TaxID=245188 RepID=UPI00035F2701|nr:hypothetical protein [Yoonia vestfoldensis]
MIGLELSPAYAAAAARDPLAAFFAKGSGAHVALAPGPQGGLTVWTETGPATAACLRLDGVNAATRLSWRETLTCALRKVYPVAAFGLSAGWSQLQSSGSGLSGSYTGNRAISTSSLAATVSVTVDRAKPYDLWICFTGRTSGGYCRVDIDGGQALVDAIGDPAGLGFKAFSTHTATDMQRRRSIRVATGLTGTHVVLLSHGGVATPGGNSLMIEALALSADLSDDGILPPVWQPATSYVMGDEVQWQGTFYAARATGISGTMPPAHLSGIGGDGALDWRADNRPTYPQFQAIDYASEREYAARIVIDGAATEIGGQTHGNETLVSRSVTVDAAPFVPAIVGTGLRVGAEIVSVENTTWQRGSGGDIGECQMTRRITPGEVRHDVQVTATGPAATFEWLYLGMLPLVHWDGESAAVAVQHVRGPENSVSLADFAGQTPANIGFGATTRLGLSGRGVTGDLVYGCQAAPSPVPGNLIGPVTTFLRPNIEGHGATGSLDWIAKAYVAADLPAETLMQAGDVIGFSSRHIIAVNPVQA